MWVNGDRDDEVVNLAHFERVRIIKSNGGRYPVRRWVAYKSDGEEVELGCPNLEDIMAMVHVVPAQPGYLVLTYWSDGTDGPAQIDREPVIAWGISPQSEFGARPITVDGMEHNFGDNNDRSKVVLSVSGMVYEPGMSVYKSEEEWLSHAASWHSPEAVSARKAQQEAWAAKRAERQKAE